MIAARTLLIAIALVCTSACPGVKHVAPTPAKCMKQYERCKLPSGPLGVCDLARCEDGRTSCLKCIPQH